MWQIQTVPQRAAVKSAQGTSKYPLGVPHELSLSSKAGPGHYRLPTNRTNREETTLCSQGRHWPPHSLVIANQDHHFPMKLVHPTHRLPRGLLLQSGSLPQLQTSVASAESTFRLLKTRSGEKQAGRHPRPQTHTQNLPQGNAGQVGTPTQAQQGRRRTEPCLQKLGSSIKKTLQCRGQPLSERVSPLSNNKRNPPLLEVGVDNLRFFTHLWSE